MSWGTWRRKWCWTSTRLLRATPSAWYVGSHRRQITPSLPTAQTSRETKHTRFLWLRLGAARWLKTSLRVLPDLPSGVGTTHSYTTQQKTRQSVPTNFGAMRLGKRRKKTRICTRRTTSSTISVHGSLKTGAFCSLTVVAQRQGNRDTWISGIRTRLYSSWSPDEKACVTLLSTGRDSSGL
eukprot:Lithocolla_globosa_v1_NODE_1903_length_2264_cov_492.284744.p3 type:complete len:181 gc:universal NODE_1903_length_2264_cov_492.284744:436-978(+)